MRLDARSIFDRRVYSRWIKGHLMPSKPFRRARSYSRSPGLAGRETQSGKRNHRPCDVTPLTIFTIGHSTRPIDEFIRRLKAHGVQRVVDVRTIPRLSLIHISEPTR